jgi:hypothetical protein
MWQKDAHKTYCHIWCSMPGRPTLQTIHGMHVPPKVSKGLVSSMLGPLSRCWQQSWVLRCHNLPLVVVTVCMGPITS